MRDELFFSGAEPVTLEMMLEVRERRACIQQKLIEAYDTALISFTLNIPGEYKLYPLVNEAFEEGLGAIRRSLKSSSIKIMHTQILVEKTGCEAYFAVNQNAPAIKGIMIQIEEDHPLGRYFDIDVLDSELSHLNGEDYGRKQRACIICGKPVWECSRSRAHSADTLAFHTAMQLHEFFSKRHADHIGQLAVRALLYEVSATPKPGLVDRNNSGSHADMDFYTFLNSSCALIPYYRDITLAAQRYKGEPEQLLNQLRPMGLLAEDAMLASTGGVNTHKGLIFSIGIVCAALGTLWQCGRTYTTAQILDMCARIALNSESSLEYDPHIAPTNGQRIFQESKITGVRGEAARGFPNVRDYSLPVLCQLVQEGYSLNDAGVVALLHLIANVDDTNMIHRSDLQRAGQVKKKLAATLKQGHDVPDLLKIASAYDIEFIDESLSPGGSADLLAVTYMVYFALENAR